MIAWIIGGLLVALVALYLVSPPVRRRRLSAARFLTPLPRPPRPLGGRIRLERLLNSPLFWLQLLVLATLCWAAWSVGGRGPVAGPRAIGLWLLLDTSASMSVVQDGQPRMLQAQLLAAEAMTSSNAATLGGAWCARLAAFDMEWRDLQTAGDPLQAMSLLSALVPRPLGTDLEQLRGRLAAGGQVEEPGACPITDILVVSDRPAPPWLAEIPLPVKWQDVGRPAANVGFTDIQPVRNQLTGEVVEIRYEIVAYGSAPGLTTLTISGPDGVIREEGLSWADLRVIQDRFRPTVPGEYTLALSPDGVYGYDDSAQLRIEPAEPIRLDWRLADRSTLDQLGWSATTEDALAQVIGYAELSAADPGKPALVVGPGYAPAQPPIEQRIGDFDEASPLIADLNLDVAERAGIVGQTGLPASFEPVLRGSDGAIWIAVQPEPLAVYVPGLPLWNDDNSGVFSQTVFFNALRLLLNQRPFDPIYSLTSPAAPEPDGTRLALHPGEGDTGGEPLSTGSLERWEPAGARAEQSSLWPLLVVVAGAILLIERIGMILRGDRWG